MILFLKFIIDTIFLYFTGGLFGLAADTLSNNWSERYMDIAKGITQTCHQSYDNTYTKLGPESFRFSDGVEAKALKSQEKYYILRPETFESYFIMWRITHDQKYRDWGWEAIEVSFEFYLFIKKLLLNAFILNLFF